MKSILSIGKVGAASKLRNGCAGNVTPVGAIAEFKLLIVTMLPVRPAKESVGAGPISAFCEVKGGKLAVQLVVVVVNVTAPEILNTPVIGAAATDSQKTRPSTAVVSRILVVMTRSGQTNVRQLTT